MTTRLHSKDEDKLEYYLGRKLECKDQNKIVLHQPGHVKKLLEPFLNGRLQSKYYITRC